MKKHKELKNKKYQLSIIIDAKNLEQYQNTS